VNRFFLHQLNARLDEILFAAFDRFKRFAPEDEYASTTEGKRLIKAAGAPKLGQRTDKIEKVMRGGEMYGGPKPARLDVWSQKKWRKERRESYEVAEAKNQIANVEKLHREQAEALIAERRGKTILEILKQGHATDPKTKERMDAQSLRSILAPEVIPPEKVGPGQSKGMLEHATESKIRNVRGYAADVLGTRRRIIHGYAKAKGIGLKEAYGKIDPKHLDVFATRLSNKRVEQVEQAKEKFGTYKSALRKRLETGAATTTTEAGAQTIAGGIMENLATRESPQVTHYGLYQLLKRGSKNPRMAGAKSDFVRNRFRRQAGKVMSHYEKLESAASETPKVLAGHERRILSQDPYIFTHVEQSPLYKKGLVDPGTKNLKRLGRGLGIGLGGAAVVGAGAYGIHRYLKSREARMSSRERLIMFASRKRKIVGALTPQQVRKAAQDLAESWKKGGFGTLKRHEFPRTGHATKEEVSAKLQQAGQRKADRLAESLHEQLTPKPQASPVMSEEALRIIGNKRYAIQEAQTVKPAGVPITTASGKKIYWRVPNTYTEKLLGRETNLTKTETLPGKPGKLGTQVKVAVREPVSGKTEGATTADVGTLKPATRAAEITNPPPSPPGMPLQPLQSRVHPPIGGTPGERPHKPPATLARVMRRVQQNAIEVVQKELKGGIPLDEAHKLHQEVNKLREENAALTGAHDIGYKKGWQTAYGTGESIGISKGLESGAKKAAQDRGPILRAAHEEVKRAQKSGRKEVERQRRRNIHYLLGGAGVGAAAGAGAGWVAKPREQRYMAKLREIRFDDKRRGTFGHDVATGALEGGLVGPFTEPIFAKLQGRMPERILKGGWPAFGKKALIGAGLGAASTALVGAGVHAIGITRQRRKTNQKLDQLRQQYPNSGFSSMSKLIEFIGRRPVLTDVDIAPVDRQRGTGSPIRVVKDRYSKEIINREHNRRDANYARTAAAGAALGALFKNKLKMPIGRAVLVGAGAGAATQAVVRNVVTKHMTDPFGEKTVAAKRIDLAPWVGGGAVAAGVGVHRLYKRSPLAQKVVRKYFRANGKLITFARREAMVDDEGFTQAERKQQERWVYGRRRKTYPAAQALVQKVQRGSRILESAGESISGTAPLDSKGRPKKKEWEKKWFQGALLATGVAGGIAGISMLKKGLAAAPKNSQRQRLYKAWQNADVPQMVERAVPGARKVGKFVRGVKREAAYKFEPGAKKMAERIEEASGVKNAETVVEEGKKRDALLKRLGDIASGNWGKKKPPTNLSARLREIRFAEQVAEWRIADARGNSARVYKPDHQKRDRSKLPFYKKKGTIEAALAATAAAVPVAIWGGRRYGARYAVKKALKPPKPPPPPPPGGGGAGDPYIWKVRAEEAKRKARRAARGEDVEFSSEDKRKIIQPAAITGGSTLGGAVIGSQLIGGHKLQEGESITGKRIVRRNRAFLPAYHEGVGVGGGNVVEVRHRGLFGKGEVRKVSREEFGSSKLVRVLDDKRSPKGARRALRQVGKDWNYNVFTRNCSDFSELCRGTKKRFLPSRQWRRTGVGAAAGLGAGIGASILVNRLQDHQFKSKDEYSPVLSKRNVAIAGGLGAAGVGAATFSGARPFLKIAARNWIAKGEALRHGENAAGHFVADYIEGARKGLGNRPQRYLAKPFFESAKKNPKGLPAKIVSNKLFDPDRLGPSFASSHMLKFQKGGIEGLNHWDWEVNKHWEHQHSVISAANPKLAARSKRRLDSNQLEHYYGKEKALRAINHLMTTAGLDEHQAIRRVATTGMSFHPETGVSKNDAQVQKFFHNLAKNKAGAAAGYAKKGLISPALIGAGASTAGTAAFVGGPKKRRDNGQQG
jgi:hypothetical protein